MNILMATSEAVPFAKTGGLADVCGALPVELAKLGHEPTVILPAYRQMRQSGLPIEPTGIEFDVPIGSKMVTGSFLEEPLARQRGAGLSGRAGPVLRPRRRSTGRRRRTTSTTASGSSSSAGPCWKRSGCWTCRSTCCTPTTGRPA